MCYVHIFAWLNLCQISFIPGNHSGAQLNSKVVNLVRTHTKPHKIHSNSPFFSSSAISDCESLMTIHLASWSNKLVLLKHKCHFVNLYLKYNGSIQNNLFNFPVEWETKSFYGCNNSLSGCCYGSWAGNISTTSVSTWDNGPHVYIRICHISGVTHNPSMQWSGNLDHVLQSSSHFPCSGLYYHIHSHNTSVKQISLIWTF